MGLEVEVLAGGEPAPGGGETLAPPVAQARVAAAAARAAEAAGVPEGHVAVAFVGPDAIRALNRLHRAKDSPTDVLSFPVDEAGAAAGPRELGDIVICPPETADVVEAVVHGVLHLCGHDHEADGGEMLALQARVLDGLGA